MRSVSRNTASSHLRRVVGGQREAGDVGVWRGWWGEEGVDLKKEWGNWKKDAPQKFKTQHLKFTIQNCPNTHSAVLAVWGPDSAVGGRPALCGCFLHAATYWKGVCTMPYLSWSSVNCLNRMQKWSKVQAALVRSMTNGLVETLLRSPCVNARIVCVYFVCVCVHVRVGCW